MQYKRTINIKKQGYIVTSRRQSLKAFWLPAVAAFAPIFALAQTLPGAPPPEAGAAPPSATAQKYTNNMYLGYVRSSSGQLNSDAQHGMDALAAEVKKRTTLKLAGAVGLNPAQDDLSYFRFIYWPITPDAQPLSDAARQRVQHYMDSGGIILFDARDAGGVMRDQRALRRVLADLNIAPLTTLGEGHTLTKTFFLLAKMPGSSAHGATWVETNAPKGTEAISAVIIGENNWADAWAGKTVLPGTKERENALRAGINMVLYAYAGNFKTDPINDVLKKMAQP